MVKKKKHCKYTVYENEERPGQTQRSRPCAFYPDFETMMRICNTDNFPIFSHKQTKTVFAFFNEGNFISIILA